jgi:hypothetical protein
MAKTTLFNFAPNNWEPISKSGTKFVNASWVQDGHWHSHSILLVEPGGYAEVTSDHSSIIAGDSSHIFLSMSEVHISEVGLELPHVFDGGTSYPQWRASMEISSHISRTSYLGEMSPFPSKSSCLSFGGMVQPLLKNSIIFLNLECLANERVDVLEVQNSTTGKLLDRFEVKNNSINVIELDHLQFEVDDLLVVTCKGMGGIPLYFSYDVDFSSMSLEHSHPPSSFVVHGRRSAVQSELKRHWFKKFK